MLRALYRLLAFSLFLSINLIALGCNYNDKVISITDDDEPTNQLQPDQNQNDKAPDLIEHSLFTNCAASGVASGDGYQLTHCTGPTDMGTQDLSGSGFILQAGTFRQLPPAR